jgi:hypothetical protein
VIGCVRQEQEEILLVRCISAVDAQSEGCPRGGWFELPLALSLIGNTFNPLSRSLFCVVFDTSIGSSNTFEWS